MNRPRTAPRAARRCASAHPKPRRQLLEQQIRFGNIGRNWAWPTPAHAAGRRRVLGVDLHRAGGFGCNAVRSPGRRTPGNVVETLWCAYPYSRFAAAEPAAQRAGDRRRTARPPVPGTGRVPVGRLPRIGKQRRRAIAGRRARMRAASWDGRHQPGKSPMGSTSADTTRADGKRLSPWRTTEITVTLRPDRNPVGGHRVARPAQMSPPTRSVTSTMVSSARAGLSRPLPKTRLTTVAAV